MKCKDCPDYVDNICQKAQLEKFSELEGDCLVRIQCMLLRDIWTELVILNEDTEEGEGWKKE